jgi:hypothetical protein
MGKGLLIRHLLRRSKGKAIFQLLYRPCLLPENRVSGGLFRLVGTLGFLFTPLSTAPFSDNKVSAINGTESAEPVAPDASASWLAQQLRQLDDIGR